MWRIADDNPSRERDDCFIATGTAAVIAGIAAATASTAAAKMSSNSAKNASNAQTQAANHAADVQAQAARDALEFQRQQAQRDQENFLGTQRANYDQWAAGSGNEYNQYVSTLKNTRAEAVAGGHNDYNKWSARDQRIGKLGEMLGLGQRVTPAYEEIAPLDIPTNNIPPYAGGPSGQSGPPNANLQSAIASELKASNSSDDPGYWANVIAQHGDSPTKNWAYWQNRIRTGDGVGKGYRGTAASMLG